MTSIYNDPVTCDYCGISCERKNPRTGTKMFKKYDGHMLCSTHYSEARFPDTYIGEPAIQEWLDDE